MSGLWSVAGRSLGGAALAAALASSAPLAAEAAGAAAGKTLYKQFCSHCHGIDMVNPGTASFDLRRFPPDQKDRFVASVTKGKRDMPAWGDILRPEEVEALWLYIRTGGKQ